MPTNFNPLLNLFKVGHTQNTNATQTPEKIGSQNSKSGSIFNEAGMNTFAEDSIGDSFTRTTKTTEKAQANNETKTTQPLNATGKNSTTTFGSTTNFATKAGSTANSFGMLSSKANNIDNENKNETKTEKNGFGSLSVSGGGSQYTVNNDNEIKELAEELGCDATEDAVKNELQGMSAK